MASGQNSNCKYRLVLSVSIYYPGCPIWHHDSTVKAWSANLQEGKLCHLVEPICLYKESCRWLNIIVIDIMQ